MKCKICQQEMECIIGDFHLCPNKCNTRYTRAKGIYCKTRTLAFDPTEIVTTEIKFPKIKDCERDSLADIFGSQVLASRKVFLTYEETIELWDCGCGKTPQCYEQADNRYYFRCVDPKCHDKYTIGSHAGFGLSDSMYKWNDMIKKYEGWDEIGVLTSIDVESTIDDIGVPLLGKSRHEERINRSIKYMATVRQKNGNFTFEFTDKQADGNLFCLHTGGRATQLMRTMLYGKGLHYHYNDGNPNSFRFDRYRAEYIF